LSRWLAGIAAKLKTKMGIRCSFRKQVVRESEKWKNTKRSKWDGRGNEKQSKFKNRNTPSLILRNTTVLTVLEILQKLT
jgi:hypothetical protein